MGDFSENAAYQIAKWRMRSLMYRIDEISGFLKTAEIIQKPQGDKIKVGHTVTIASAEKAYTYTILGSTQTDPSNGKISYQSKLGEALIGQTVGDIIKLETPSTTIEYEIIEIN
jgi:transcription elongation factor GreA